MSVFESSVGSFDSLRREVILRGLLIVTQRTLRDLLGKRRNGPRVNASISDELQMRGILHSPKNLPTSQDHIVILTMRGSPGERALTRYHEDTRKESGQTCREIDADPAVWRSPGGASGSVCAGALERLNTCTDCGHTYSVRETLAGLPMFWDSPYDYALGSAHYCLACWLDVGPKATARMERDYLEALIAGAETMPSPAWLARCMAELALTPRALAEATGVCERTVKNWQKKGLPTQGAGALMIKLTFERMLRDREATQG
jgi:hypothetical protein